MIFDVAPTNRRIGGPEPLNLTTTEHRQGRERIGAVPGFRDTVVFFGEDCRNRGAMGINAFHY